MHNIFNDVLLPVGLLAAFVIAGSHCENLVLNKPTKLSGAYTSRPSAELGENDKCDNNTGSCIFAQSGVPSRPAWWQVDLQRTYEITSFIIIASNNYDEYKYLGNFIVTVSDNDGTESEPICYNFNNAAGVYPGARIQMNCYQKLIGRYVTVKRNGGYRSDRLIMRDQQINGTIVSAQRPIWYNGGACGISKYANAGELFLPSGRIVGGVDARAHEFPWQISMRSMSGFHYCGGSIINERWIATASHCVDGSVASNVQIVVGDHTRNDTSNAVRRTHNVSSIIMHPAYNSSREMYDVALVKLATPIAFNQDVAPVCAPDTSNLYTNRVSQVSGWGTLVSGGETASQTLRYVTLNVTTNDQCKAIYRNGTNYTITRDMICTTDNTGSNQRDACQGDSGGPLTVKNTDGSFLLIGIVSWGEGCASGYPGVYARVTVFNSWITSTIASS